MRQRRGKRVNIMAKLRKVKEDTNKEVILTEQNNVIAITEEKDLKDKPVEREVKTPLANAENREKHVQFLTEFVDSVNAEDSVLKPDKTLLEIIAYTIKNAAKAKYTDIVQVVTDVHRFLDSAVNEAGKKPLEALKRPEKKDQTPKTEDPKKDEMPEEIKKDFKKTDGKPKKPNIQPPKKNAIETVPGTTTKGTDNYPIAVMFPKELELENADFGTLVAAYDKYTTWEEIIKALSENKVLYFATFWTKRQIKDFNYNGQYFVKAPKEGFPHDLDILEAAVPCETIKRLWCMSVYTEALYRFEAEDFEYVEDTDPRGDGKKQFRVRISAGMEFEIYEPKEQSK